MLESLQFIENCENFYISLIIQNSYGCEVRMKIHNN